MTTATISRPRRTADEFAESLVETMNHASLALMTSIGHRTGLFDVMAGRRASTSHEIAAAAGLDERYVREWLGAMATGGVVDLDADERETRYTLPDAHAACLTRAAAPNNLAALTQYVAELGSVEDGIVRCFREGGGVPYEAFPRFHEIMAEDSGQSVLPALLDTIVPLVPGLTSRLENGIDVLDLGCGRGRALVLLAEAFPRSRFLGYDLSPEAVEHGRRSAARRGLRNVQLEARDVTGMDDDARFDLVTAFDAIHDQARPDVVLAAIRRALRPSGVFLMQDIRASTHVHGNLDHPIGPLLYTISCMHCMTVSLAQGGMGLGTVWGREQALAMLSAAGFHDVRVEDLPHDFQNSYYIANP